MELIALAIIGVIAALVFYTSGAESKNDEIKGLKEIIAILKENNQSLRQALYENKQKPPYKE